MPLFSIPLSGLNATSNALNVVSNNLANLNTVGYKDQSVNFRDLFYQTVGSTGAGEQVQVGAGTGIDSVSSNFTDGNIDPTGVSTNAAITGQGFFVVEKDGVQSYTRAGDFTLSPTGALITQDGASVLGFPSVNGQITTGQGLSPLLIAKGQTSPANPTGAIQLNVNLDASAAVGATFNSPIAVYDSLGTAHNLSFQFTKTGANTWGYAATIPGADVGQMTPMTIASGSLIFDSNGNLTSPTGNVAISIGGLADGASTLNFNWALTDPNGNTTISQQASPSTTSSAFQDGNSSGTLTDFTIAQDGTIEGTFTNNKSFALGQIALATFSNSEGLARTGSNNYASTIGSGAAVIGAPGAGGRGTLSGGALEQSNVDIAQEFTQMITTQRGFQANAKVITTFDEVTQDTINLVR